MARLCTVRFLSAVRASGGMLQAPLCPPPRPVPRICGTYQGNYKRKENERERPRRRQKRSGVHPLNRFCRRHEAWRNPCGIVDFFTVCSGIVDLFSFYISFMTTGFVATERSKRGECCNISIVLLCQANRAICVFRFSLFSLSPKTTATTHQGFVVSITIPSTSAIVAAGPAPPDAPSSFRRYDCLRCSAYSSDPPSLFHCVLLVLLYRLVPNFESTIALLVSSALISSSASSSLASRANIHVRSMFEDCDNGLELSWCSRVHMA